MRKVIESATKKAVVYSKKINAETIHRVAVSIATVVTGGAVFWYTYSEIKSNFYPQPDLTLETQKQLKEFEASMKENHLENQRLIQENQLETREELKKITHLLTQKKDNG